MEKLVRICDYPHPDGLSRAVAEAHVAPLGGAGTAIVIDLCQDHHAELLALARRRPAPTARTPRPRGTTTRPPGPGAVARQARAEAMYQQYREGATLKEVGRAHGVTRERVRQILSGAGLPTRTPAEATERARRTDDARAEEVIGRFRESGDYTAVARAVGMSEGRVRRMVSADLPAAAAYRRRKEPEARYSEADLLVVLPQAARMVPGVLTVATYDRVRRGRRLPSGRPWPSSQVHAARFGSWVGALGRAGLPANPSSPITGVYRFREEDCVGAVRELGRRLGRAPTTREYGEYAKATAGGAPSLATVRKRLGGWSRALRLALAEGPAGDGMA